jgi:chemotaxis-related protein WspD
MRLSACSQPTQAGAGCWRSIGVYGNRACPELASWVHCRNCPVYSRTALEVLNRPLPPGYLRQWTEYYAMEAKPRRLTASSAVPFRIGSEWLSLPTKCFQEITERRPIHSIPRARPMVLGLANIRGELLICVSLGHLLGLPDIPPRNFFRANYERLLVLSWLGRRIGFPVNEIQGPHRFYIEDVKPPPAALVKAHAAYAESVLSWRERTLVLLDPDLLFSALNRNLT